MVSYSVEASLIENGKTVKGTLTLFIDEYSFGGVSKSIDWEKAICTQGMVSIKSFFRSSDKPCLTISYSTVSQQFIIEQSKIAEVISHIKSFAEALRRNREKKEAAVASISQTVNSLTDAPREHSMDNDTSHKELQPSDVMPHTDPEEYERKVNEKKTRICQEAEKHKNKPEENITLSPIAKKAAVCVLDNPYRILGISCMASNEDANSALDKLKKLSRLKALESYRSVFDLSVLEKPARDLSIAQNALVLLKDTGHKWFWFSESEACLLWNDAKYRIELAKDGFEYGTYDLFLANYLYGILCDPDFSVSETWKRILNYYCFICRQKDNAIICSRIPDKERNDPTCAEYIKSFKKNIFKPILLLCERDDLDAVLRLYNYIKDCNDRLLDNLSRDVVSKLVLWFTEKEKDMMKYLHAFSDKNDISDAEGCEIMQRGEAYCSAVDPVFEMVLRNFNGDAVKYDMIKDSYKTVTYELMFQLNKCCDKSNAIVFANRCFAYCNVDDKKRIKNTFGEANIKYIIWNIPHTKWDIQGDNFYFGRGCAVDYTQALYWYHKAADAGNMHSQNSIGVCYLNGCGVPKDGAQAVEWFEKAYKSGDPMGAYNLAECCFNGTGTAQNIDNALKYWDEAAKLGHPSAENRKNEIFKEVRIKRKSHRAANHICHDIGFQMTVSSGIVAEVTLNKAANVYLVNSKGYQNYLEGLDFSYQGGFVSSSSYNIRIPSSNHWYIIIDNGYEPIQDIVSSVKVKNI